MSERERKKPGGWSNFVEFLWDNGGSCETWRGWFQGEKTRGGRRGGEERENGSGSDEGDGDRSGRHGRGGITKIGRKKEGRKDETNDFRGNYKELENLERKKITNVGLEK